MAAIALVSACGSPPATERADTIILASGADLQSINPLIAVHPLAKQVQKHVLFLTLASYDSAFVPIPRLASWVWDSDRTSLRFTLRRDVSWHDGVPTTAEDVLWTLEMALHPAVAYPRLRDLASISTFHAVDSFTVRVEFERPQPVFPDVFTDLAILPAHRFEGLAPEAVRTAPFNFAPVGNGPFEFVEHRPNQRWVFRRASHFPADLGIPNFERFVVTVVDEATTKLAALTSAELDFAGIHPAHASFVRRDPRLDVMDYPLLFSYALVWNLRRDPFADDQVRRALMLAIDRELLVNAHVYGFGQVAAGPVPPGHSLYLETDALPYDPTRARAILEEAGWIEGSNGVLTRDGRWLEFDLLTVGSSDNALEQMIQAQLGQVGAKVGIRQVELASFLSIAQGTARDFDALITGIPGDLALSYVAAMFGGDNPGPLAYPGYHDDDFDEAIERVGDAITEAELASAWREAQRILRRDLPTTWLYHARGVQGVNRRIRGVKIDLRGELAGIRNWWMERGESRR